MKLSGLFAVVLLIGVAGCTPMMFSDADIKASDLEGLCQAYSLGKHVGSPEMTAQAEAELRLRKALTERDWSDVKNEMVRVGQKDYVAVCSWGPYDDKNVMGGSYGEHSQFVFGDNGRYVYSENGRVTSWQQ